MMLLDHLQHELTAATKRNDAARVQALRNVKAALEAERRAELSSLPEAEVRHLLGRHRGRLLKLLELHAGLSGRDEPRALVHELAVCDQLLPVLDATSLATLLHALAKSVHRPSPGRLLGALMKMAPGQVDVPKAQAMAQRLVVS